GQEQLAANAMQLSFVKSLTSLISNVQRLVNDIYSLIYLACLCQLTRQQTQELTQPKIRSSRPILIQSRPDLFDSTTPLALLCFGPTTIQRAQSRPMPATLCVCEHHRFV